MVKKFVKSVLTLGLLLSIPQFALRAEGAAAQMVNFESSLQPHDLALLEQNEQMVWMSDDFRQVVSTLSSKVPALKDLVEHVKLGYSLAPLKEVSVAVEQALKSVDPKSSAYSVIKNYQAALLKGDANVVTEELGDRRSHSSRRCGKFCQLFVQNCASLGSLCVRNGAAICGDLNVGGTVRACNFSFTGAGCTGCTQTANFPNISACGNVQFNTTTNTLNAQGSFEARMRHIQGNIAITNGDTLTLTSAAVDSAIAITAGTFPTATATNTNAGYTVGAVSGSGRSSGIENATGVANQSQYEFVVDLLIPITFTNAYATIPTVFAGLQNSTPFVSAGATALVGGTSAEIVALGASNVSTTGATINLLFHVVATGTNADAGARYQEALGNAQTAIRNVLTNLTNNGFSINFITDGQVS